MAVPIALAGLFVVVAAGGQQNRPADSAGDRDQITAIVTRWETPWNTHDMTAYASSYHDDGVWVLWTGDVWTGRRAIEDGHAAVHARRGRPCDRARRPPSIHAAGVRGGVRATRDGHAAARVWGAAQSADDPAWATPLAWARKRHEEIGVNRG